MNLLFSSCCGGSICFLKYSNLLLLAQKQPFSPQSLQSFYRVTRSSPSLQYHLLPTFSVPHLPSHTQKVFSTFLRKGSQRHTQWNTSLNDPLISSQNSFTGSGSCSFSKWSCAMSLWHCSKLYWC